MPQQRSAINRATAVLQSVARVWRTVCAGCSPQGVASPARAVAAGRRTVAARHPLLEAGRPRDHHPFLPPRTVAVPAILWLLRLQLQASGPRRRQPRRVGCCGTQADGRDRGGRRLRRGSGKSDWAADRMRDMEISATCRWSSYQLNTGDG